VAGAGGPITRLKRMIEATAGSEGTTGAAVRAEQVRTVYGQSPWITALNLVNAAIVGTVLWSPARATLIIAWVGATALVAASRVALRARYLRATEPRDVRWARWYVVGAGAAGSLWGAASLLLLGKGDHASELILIFVIAGMGAGAAGTLAWYLPAFYLFAIPAILPLAVRILAQGGALHVAMGLLTVLYAVALSFVATHTNRAVADAFRLRFQNERLFARLSRARAALEESNRTLERRVAERSAALKRQDDALHEARRMESLGLLAGGVAHDFNNLLTVILGNTVLLQDSPTLAAQPDGPLAEVRKAAERAAVLVSQLLASTRRQARLPRVLDLNAVVSDAHKLLARLIGEHIELVVRLHAGPLPVDADPAQLEQVIVNLATNARDAMPSGGRLTLETDLLEDVEGDSVLPPGAYATLSVLDTGVGMDAETARKAFHPFFTTKEVGHGTGLGLATVNGIVEQSGGRVFVETEPGKGSCFRVMLPRAQAPVVAAAPPAAPTPRPRAGTVLVVEDEPMVRAVIARALVGAGLTVLEAEDGEQALARAEAHEGAIELLVTDVVMARMGGLELAERLASARPGVRVLFISGYSREAELSDGGGLEGVEYLQKPFTSDAVVERVSRLLAAAPPAPITPSQNGASRARAR
jgi:signal transduction histidine kinase/CheY-like chemotaxis protein